MKRPAFLFLAALSGAATASAQPTIRLGLRGGANRAVTTLAATSTSTGNYPFNYSADKSAIYAWQAGAVLEIAFRKIGLQPALVFSQKGEQFDMQTSTSGVAGPFSQTVRSTNRYNWLELPINVVYMVHGVQLFAGPYVALAVGGREHSTGKLTSPTPVTGPDEYEYGGKIQYGTSTENRRFDAGVNFGIGYRRGPLQMQFGYGLGLRNLHQPLSLHHIINANTFFHDFNADAAYNRVAQLTGTYFFEL